MKKFYIEIKYFNLEKIEREKLQRTESLKQRISMFEANKQRQSSQNQGSPSGEF